MLEKYRISFSRKAAREKFNHGLPAARTRLRSESDPWESAPMAALESMFTTREKFSGHALIKIDAAAISGIKLFPSAQIESPPFQIGTWSPSVMSMPHPEFFDFDLTSVDPSV